jgi:hypothetical protein
VPFPAGILKVWGDAVWLVARAVITIAFISSVRRHQRTSGAVAGYRTGDHLPDDGELTGDPKAADWYPDPAGRFSWRWWDGTAWTDRVRSRTEEQSDPLGGDWS